MVKIVAPVVGLLGIVAQQIIVAELRDLGTGRTLGIRGIGFQVDIGAKQGQSGIVGNRKLIFERHRIARLLVVSLVAVRCHLMGVHQQVGRAVRTELAAFNLGTVNLGIK